MGDGTEFTGLLYMLCNVKLTRYQSPAGNTMMATVTGLPIGVTEY